MFRSREGADESTEHELETALRLLRLEFRDRGLVSDDDLQFRDEVDDQSRVRAKRLRKCVAPNRQLGVALAEKRPDKAAKSLYQGRIGDVALVLVELSRRE